MAVFLSSRGKLAGEITSGLERADGRFMPLAIAQAYGIGKAVNFRALRPVGHGHAES